MKERALKSLVFLLIAALLIAGCASNQGGNGGKTTTDAGSNTGNGTANNGSTETDEKPEPMTITGFFGDQSPTWVNMQDEVGKYLTEKTGITVDAEFAVGDAKQKINLIAASGRYPDIINPGGHNASLIDAGALLDLTDLIEEHAPNIKKVLGDQINRLRFSEDDPSIYFIPNLDAVDNQYFDAGGPFNLQHAVVKELGYPKIRTVKDYEEAIKAYKEKYPTINGQPTIGLSLLADDWRILISVTDPASSATGAGGDGEYYIDPETYEAMLHYKRPEEREYFRWLNHMNNIGLLDPESFVQKYDQYKAKIASGRVLATIDQEWQIGEAENALKAAGMHERAYGHYPVTMDESMKPNNFQDSGFTTFHGMGITTSAKDPVRIIKFLDFLASEEGQILNSWGIEDKHYNVIDGKRVIPQELLDIKINDNTKFTKETGIGNYRWSIRYGDGVKDSTGNFFTTTNPEQIRENYSEIEKEVLEAYGLNYWKDHYPKEDEFPKKTWGRAWSIPIPPDSEMHVINQKVRDIMMKRIPEAILAKPENFDKVYDTMLDEFEKAGAAKMEQGMTELVKKRVELWK